MAPHKSTPHSSNTIKNMRGITFSLDLAKDSDPPSSVTLTETGSNATDESCRNDYNLKVSIHTISSTSLIKRMNVENDSLIKYKQRATTLDIDIKIKPKKTKVRKRKAPTPTEGECIWVTKY
jgi:hypothetical protein